MLPVVLVLVLVLVLTWVAVNAIAVRTIARANTRDRAYDCGRDAAQLIIDRRGLAPVTVRSGDVDAYLAGEQVIQLAEGRYRGQSLAAAVIAAHEAGHAAQHRDGAGAWRVWWTLGWPSIVAGFAVAPVLVFAVFNGAAWLIILTLVLLAVMLAAAAVSWIVERGATRWALAALREEELIDPGQVPAARRVLRAAGALYVAESLWDPGAVIRRLRPRGDGAPGDNAGGAGQGGFGDGQSGSGNCGGGGCGGGGGG